MSQRVFFALGSSVGDRRENLRECIRRLASAGLGISAVSPVVETPAMLPSDAASDWNVPYLNLVVDGVIKSDDPLDALVVSKRVQKEMSSTPESRWAPRVIDIDLLCFGDSVIEINGKTIPSLADVTRPFVMTPLLHLDPSLMLPGIEKSIFELTRSQTHPVPLWMGVVNLTPDSFSLRSDQLTEQGMQHLESVFTSGAQIIDVGGESVRPGAQPMSSHTEWLRIEKSLEWLIDQYGCDPVAPWISVDTRHPETARRALDLGVQMINDVGGLRHPEMRRLAADSDARFVVMHSLNLPPDPNELIATTADPIDVIAGWWRENQMIWEQDGIDPNRLVLDPGICFGKSRLQSQDIMRRIPELRALGARALVGHSRKGFIRELEAKSPADRDIETAVASMAMAARGVDFVRVHNVELHARAWLTWAHVTNMPFKL